MGNEQTARRHRVVPHWLIGWVGLLSRGRNDEGVPPRVLFLLMDHAPFGYPTMCLDIVRPIPP